MKVVFRAAAVLPLLVVTCFSAHVTLQAQSVPSIRKVEVLHTSGQVEIEVEASDRVVPQINLVKNPDRLIVDFVNALPGAQLRGQAVNRAEVKSVRVGLFSKDPPVTRIVLDLAGPQPYQVFPSGRTVIVKVGAGSVAGAYRNTAPMLTSTTYSAAGAHLSVDIPPPPRPVLVVSFRDGMLTINANKASLSEVLYAVQQRTGAEIAIPAGAEQEQVVAELGPAPAPEVLSHLLNGSKFNFLILNSSSDPRILDRVILSSRPVGQAPLPPPRSAPVMAADDEDTDVQPRNVPPPVVRPAPGITPPPSDPNVNPANGIPGSPEAKPQPDSNDVPD
jgi:hypothetical protein